MSLMNTLIPSLSRTPATTTANRPADLADAVKPIYSVTENDDAFGLTV